MAIIELEKTKKYKIDVPIGYNGNKRIRHIETVYCTKKEALLRENEIKLEIKNNTYINKQKVTVSTFIGEWLKSIKNTVAIKTYNNYKLYCKNICKNLGHIKLVNLNAKTLDSFYNELKTKSKYADRTIKDHYTAMTTILNTAIKWEYLNSNPNLKSKPIKVTKKEIQCYSPDEVNHLLQILKFQPIKYQALILLALDSSCRRGELTGLTWDDIDFARGTIDINKTTQYVPGYGIFEKPPKTASSVRTIYLAPTTIQILKKYRKEQLTEKMRLGDIWENSNRVFTSITGGNMHPNTPSKILSNIIKQNNLKYISFHGLRHTSISLQIASGIQAQIISKRAGHANLSTTHKIYSHFFENGFQEVANKMDKYLHA